MISDGIQALTWIVSTVVLIVGGVGLYEIPMPVTLVAGGCFIVITSLVLVTVVPKSKASVQQGRRKRSASSNSAEAWTTDDQRARDKKAMQDLLNR